mgnify:CR=1 FL=1
MTNRKSIRYLSLAAKAGHISLGMKEVLQESRKNNGYLVVLAADAGENTKRKARSLSANNNIKLVQSDYTKEEISDAVGHGRDMSIVLFKNKDLAEAFSQTHAKEWEERK